MHTKSLEVAQLKQDVPLESFSYMVLSGHLSTGYIASLDYLIRICACLFSIYYDRFWPLSSAIRKVSKSGVMLHL